MLKKANIYFVLPCFTLGYLDETNSSTEATIITSYIGTFIITYVCDLHNFCINVSHTCIPNDVVGGARNVYENRFPQCIYLIVFLDMIIYTFHI